MKKIVISGGIGYDVIAPEVRKLLSESKGEDLDVHLASPGGFVYDGLEVFNAFRDYKRENPKAQIMLTIKGLAASMGSYIAVNEAFDLIAAEDNAVFMIHNPYNFAIGDYNEMQKNADYLKGLSDLLANAYVKKTGKSKKEISKMMDDTTWLFGDEIKDAGFVDEIIKTDESKEKASAVAVAQSSFKAIIDKMSKDESAKNDLAKSAAMITTSQTKHSEPPAPAGENNTGGTSEMNLDEFLKSNPAAKAEYDAKISASYDDGVKAVRETVAKAAPYLSAESAYPKQITALAVDVVKGEKPIDALMTTVTVFDAMNEKDKSDKAADESDKSKDSKGEAVPGETTKDGIIKNEEDFRAEVNRARAAKGLQEVK